MFAGNMVFRGITSTEKKEFEATPTFSSYEVLLHDRMFLCNNAIKHDCLILLHLLGPSGGVDTLAF